MKKIQLLIFVFVLCGSQSSAQYYGERVLEKSFEQTDFFFKPFYINPFGAKGFSSAVPGVIDHPLLNLQINPANTYRDSVLPIYTYIDIRSTSSMMERDYFDGPMPMLEYSSSIDRMYYPPYNFSPRKLLEPVLSASLLMQPLKNSLPGFFIGISYQMMLQNDKYYSIPHDIYRSSYGSDYSGRSVTALSEMPVVDKYSGEDNLHQSGHFTSLHLGYELSSTLTIGGKVSYVTFTRDGSYGSTKFSDYIYFPSNSNSSWSNIESRNQNYKHWDVSGGINYTVSQDVVAGLHAGYIIGDVDQHLNRLDQSLYQYGTVNVDSNWSYSQRYSSSKQQWQHDGTTTYGGFNVLYKISSQQTFSAMYNVQQQQIDLSLGSGITDSSRYSYRNTWSGIVNSYLGYNRLSDKRTGSGSKNGTTHNLGGALRWDLESGIMLNIGMVYQRQTATTVTSEAVIASSFSTSSSSSTGYGSTNSTSELNEDKNLQWTYNTSQTTIQVPVILLLKASSYIDLMFGINRQISDWKIEDATMAVFKFRETSDGTTTDRKSNFAERYTEPTERVSDIKTTLMGGLIISPNDRFNVRFIVTPTIVNMPYRDSETEFQWWIGVTFHP